MYISISELAAYLELSEEYIVQQIRLGHVKAIFDGKEYLLNREQFIWHKEQLDLKRKQLAQEAEEPLPEDWDAKDED
ncbi:excisionase family DNA-binding protein [Alkalihalobacillus sp. MEB130]|uniref:excisionase family DNA-binding protein n=1 Tax=Alkalihalobacillus sp. MEB130 TaxID=2976704 RepID=UPI0028E02313|nr:excisionase family DNA-binding protein [Alkalihalobacillus sp. MEB130]MDT8862728.1 excisionase family DNA-binding protein [Alkalihalobacillus sp. MEB130]